MCVKISRQHPRVTLIERMLIRGTENWLETVTGFRTARVWISTSGSRNDNFIVFTTDASVKLLHR
jgi:hypothetical protein